jgi:hypothetical protein
MRDTELMAKWLEDIGEIDALLAIRERAAQRASV